MQLHEERIPKFNDEQSAEKTVNIQKTVTLFPDLVQQKNILYFDLKRHVKLLYKGG